MRRHRRRKTHRVHGPSLIVVDGVAPNPEFDHEPLPAQILGIAMDQRAFGPRQLMVAFAAFDGRFLALLYCRRTEPVDDALEACLLHFDSLGRGGEANVAAVVLCDEPVGDGPTPPEFTAKFESAKRIAHEHAVHLVDWIGCDDDLFRCARLRTFTPTTEAGWWDVPDLSAAS